MLVGALTAGLVAPALWDTPGGLAGSMAAYLTLGLCSFGLWKRFFHKAGGPG
jgi:membrane protein implicated in regulation of membrane protease activity